MSATSMTVGQLREALVAYRPETPVMIHPTGNPDDNPVPLSHLGRGALLVEGEMPRPIVAALDALPAPACTGQRYDVNPDAPEEGTDVRHDTPCPVHVDLGWATRGNTAVLTTMPVADVPVDGSVEVRPVGGAGRFGPWVHVIGEQQAVGGDENRSLLIDGVPEPFTWHRGTCVQVRPFRPVDEDLVEARHRAENGGL